MIKKDKSIGLRLTTQVYDFLKEIADKDDESIPNVIRKILKLFMAKK